MSSLDREAPKHWRTLEEHAGEPSALELAAREFMELLPTEVPPATRRRFLQLAAATAALAGTSGCISPTWPRWPVRKILPYSYRPEGQMDGIPQYFATCMELGGVARPLLAKSYDGRPIKIEGNPEHPMSRGAADLWSQASVLDLYDPDRSPGVARFERGAAVNATWDDFLAAFGPVLAERRSAQGQGLHVLAEPSSSPALAAVRARFLQAFPNADWHEWNPLSRDAVREGARLAYGRPLRPRLRPEAAAVIVCLDDDFLMEHPAAVPYSRAFAARRRAEDGTMCRLYVVESTMSLTGTNADLRVPATSGAVPSVAAALAARLVSGGASLPPAVADAVHSAPDVDATQRAALDAIARDLLAHRGRGLVTVGPAQPPAVHALAHAINAALGNTGATVDYAEEPDADRPSHVESIRALASAMSSGQVEALLLLGGNPVYDAPADVDFGKALARVKHSVHLSGWRDETSQACTWHVPRAHFLEAWDAALAWDGTWSLAQPLIHPLHEGQTAAELLAFLLDGKATAGQDLVREAFHARFGGGEAEWRRAVCDGFVAGSDAPGLDVSLAGRWAPLPADFARPAAVAESVEVVFRGDLKLQDGRFANNAWLQELPDPVTKLTWDNAALIAPATALALDIRDGDVLHVARGSRALELPAYLMPGQTEGSLTIALGYGRAKAGRVIELDSGGKGGGTDAYALRTTDALWVAPGATFRKTGKRYPLATTQAHHLIAFAENAKQIEGQAERLPELLREGTLEEYRKHPEFAKHVVHHPPLQSLWTEKSYDGEHKWGMAIDLAACTGCGACVVACQAENNIATVGKSEVSRGREMHWLRIDRYFSGEPANPAVAHQPVPCQQCENAPCEQVCPVAATMHSREGLNDMVYNRCVGTRYCSNNCPYKVRRFNWFNNWSDQPEILSMQHNPDVTVRARGVMEKCTYCVQRIKAVTIPARNDNRQVLDGEVVPACAQTCPTQAITFGDLNDPASRVSALHEHARSYAMLEELNVKPRTRYLAKLRNPAGEASA